MATKKSTSPDEYLKRHKMVGYDNQLTKSPADESPTFTKDLIQATEQPAEAEAQPPNTQE